MVEMRRSVLCVDGPTKTSALEDCDDEENTLVIDTPECGWDAAQR